MGENTSNTRRVTDMPMYREYSTTRQKCTSWNSTYSSCSSWINTSDIIPTWEELKSRNCTFTTGSGWGTVTRNGTCYDYTGIHVLDTNNSGFQYSDNSTKNSTQSKYVTPSSLTSQAEELKQCSGQGVY